MNYKQLLRHPLWQKKRLEIFHRDNWKCVNCTDEFSNLQVHHLYYEPNRLPWEYPNECFKTLCECCHEKAEFLKWMLTDGIVLLKADFSNSEIDDIYLAVENKVNTNFHHESVRTYMASIKQTIQL